MLKQHRGGTSQADVVAAVPQFGSGPTLSRYENAGVEMKPEKVDALLRYYGAPDEDREEALDCLARAKESPGWTPPAGSSEAFRALFAMESQAKTIKVYQESNVPGMLQTRGYAKALMETFSRTQHDGGQRLKRQKELEERLEFRMRRQTLLDGDHAPLYQAVIGEGALSLHRGGPLVHREQLRYLQNVAENKPRIHLRILRGSAGSAGSALHNAMTLIQPFDEEEGRMIYLENRNRGGELITDEREIEAYMASLDDLWVDACDKTETMELLQQHIDELSG
ncbi:DUF5753 domain-containing protein [Streptomyces lunalinharesii]|uniref:Helix-turn-helix transcriptional regulator n=1 Tax=Streptomyces lunalinharesii TaxID=333384 RepID=A0ABN3T6F3_9ACTN